MEILLNISKTILIELKLLLGYSIKSQLTVDQYEAIIFWQSIIILSSLLFRLYSKILKSKKATSQTIVSTPKDKSPAVKQANNITKVKTMKEDTEVLRSSIKSDLSNIEKKESSDEEIAKAEMDERENSFTMRLREEEERKIKTDKNAAKKDIKKKKKLANLSDHDDASEWKVVKRGKITDLNNK